MTVLQAAPAPATTGRLIGVDLARGLAVFGMYAAHVGPSPEDGGVVGFVMELTHGRSSALFAFLAGFAIILSTGRPVPKTGRAGRQAVVRVIIRAVLLLVLGTWLTSTGTPVDVILAYYGVFFLLVLPFHRLRPAPLAMLAVGTTLVLPQVLFAVQHAAGGLIRYDPLARLSGTGGFVDLLCTGSYPALSWVPFVFAGMAVARLDLSSATVRRRLAVTGGALAVLGYGGSWLALRVLPGVATAITEDGGVATSAWWSDVIGEPSWHTAAWLWTAAPHSETTLSIVGNTGVAMAVLAGCLAAGTRPLPRRLARPVIAVGSMSLTAYVLHIAGIWVIGGDEIPESLWLLLGFIVAAAVVALIWSRYFRRGPLEYLLHGATTLARLVR